MLSNESFPYDVFISYSHRDKDWVRNWLLPRLEAVGLRACIDLRDFEPGAPSLTEMEWAVLQSRKTLLVLTPDYLASEWTEFENILAQTLDPAARQRRLLPLLLKQCELPIHIRTLIHIDFSEPDQREFRLQRLICAIKGTEPPPPPLPRKWWEHFPWTVWSFALSFVATAMLIIVLFVPFRCMLEYKVSDAIVATISLLIGAIAAFLVRVTPLPIMRGLLSILAGVAAAFLVGVLAHLIRPPLSEKDCPWITPISQTMVTPTRCMTPTPIPTSVVYFNVYTDAGAPDNHFLPTGKMGDLGDIAVNEIWADPHSGTSSIKIVYDARGQGDKEGRYKCRRGEFTSGPCEWAGLYWLNPADNFGTVECAGFNLTGFKKLTFWARTDTPPTAVKFIVGGVGWGMEEPPPFPDSLRPPRGESQWRDLTDAWQRFEIGLTDADLSYVIGGFAWIANWDNNGITEDRSRTLIFYLDDIRFER